MRITQLEYQQKDPSRVNIYVDNRFIAGIDVSDLLKLGLHKDQEISSEEVNKIIAASEFGKLFNAALNFLSYRPRSEWEIQRKIKSQIAKLKSGSQASDQEEKVIHKLKKIGQINDKEFAHWFIDQRQTYRPKGKRALKYELLKKRVDRKIIDQVLKEPENSSEEQLATRAVQKKFERLRPNINKSTREAKQRLQRFLASRGFDWEVISIVVDRLFKEYNKSN